MTTRRRCVYTDSPGQTVYASTVGPCSHSDTRTHGRAHAHARTRTRYLAGCQMQRRTLTRDGVDFTVRAWGVTFLHNSSRSPRTCTCLTTAVTLACRPRGLFMPRFTLFVNLVLMLCCFFPDGCVHSPAAANMLLVVISYEECCHGDMGGCVTGFRWGSHWMRLGRVCQLLLCFFFPLFQMSFSKTKWH